MKKVEMVSANGGAVIEVNDDRVEHFENKGWKVAKDRPPVNQGPDKAPRSLGCLAYF